LAAVVETPSEDDGATEMLLRGVDEIRAQGDDDTLEHLRRLAPPDARFLPYRSRFSVAISGDPGCDELRGLVEDLFIWEQQGCLSPQVLFVPQAKAASLADHLLAAAEELATTWDRAPCNRHVGQRLWHQLTGEAEGDDVTFSSSPQMTLAVTNRVRPEWFGTPGFLQICPLERPEMAAELLGGLESRLSSVARSSDATVPTRLRPERIVRFGQLQSPELDWPQDGHDRFRPPR
jgi:hypothetical protein